MDNKDKFSGKAAVYHAARPIYAPEFIEYLSKDLSIGEGSVAADIGSGTGILTAQLLELDAAVFAVEPNADMRAVAEGLLSDHPRFTSVAAPAEDTGLALESIDLVTAGSAFHWFDTQAFKAECRRILKPEGQVCLVWNNREESEPLNQASKAVFERYSPNFKGFSGGLFESGTAIEDFFEGNFELHRYVNPVPTDRERYIGRALSASYALTPADPGYREFVEALGEVFDRFAKRDCLVIPHDTVAYIGRP